MRNYACKTMGWCFLVITFSTWALNLYWIIAHHDLPDYGVFAPYASGATSALFFIAARDRA